MYKYFKYFIYLVILLLPSLVKAQQQVLWYNKPAKKWTETLPIGNGRMGAMIYGGITEEHLQFNESTLWTGGPRNYQREGAATYLPQIRALLFQGKQAEAEAVAEQHFMGLKSNEANYDQQKTEWLGRIRKSVLPAVSSFDDSKWKEIKLPTTEGWEKALGDGLDGAVWFRTYFEVPASWKDKQLIISLGKIRDDDFTYINGQLVGSTKGMGEGRLYTIPASIIHAGKNCIAVQVINWNDKGGFTSAKSNQKYFAIYPEREGANNSEKVPAIWKYWVQDDAPPPFPKYQADYQPFGDIYFHFNQLGEIHNYHRDLNLSNAISTVTYEAGGVNFKREYFISEPQQVMAMHFTANKTGKINLTAFLKTVHAIESVKKIDDHTIQLYLQVKNGSLQGIAMLWVKTVGGQVITGTTNIEIKNASEADFYLTAATNYKSYKDVSGNPEAICRKTMEAARKKEYAEIRSAHSKEYQKLFNTFSLDLGNSINADFPTDERIRKFTNSADPALIALYLQYGRYLLISCSRPGSPQPANLQGLWNDLLTPPWGSKYTTNINLEMNYWPAEPLNLSICTAPLFKLIGETAETGHLTAKAHYGLDGWVLHHNTDIWRGSAPINASTHGIWVSGAAWLAHHIWEHYLFTGDTSFLQKHYSELKGATVFFSEFLVRDPKSGYLISTPSNSPEHGGLVAGPTMDHQIIRDLFKNYIAASQVLGVDADFRKKVKEQYAQIAPNKIGKYGQLQEWMEDKDDTADTHRHVSHLWGVYPGTDIRWSDTSMLKAAKQSLLYRGDEGTGWSQAWKVNLWARFKQGDHALAMIDSLLQPVETVASGKEKGGVYTNLMDAHPPFQIDGNFGAAAGIAEMLIQSQDSCIEILPALPTSWPYGKVKGICARGGFVLDMEWNTGKMQKITVLSTKGSPCILKYAGKEISLATQKGKSYSFNGDLIGL